MQPLVPQAPTTPVHQAPPSKGEDGGMGGVVGTLLAIALVFAALIWLAKPWRRSNLPRAKGRFKADPYDEKRDTPEP